MTTFPDSTDAVQQQYESYPYPARDPADEAKRLVTGSPSHPVEIDHFLFGGKRDWQAPIRILVAGGGTGDALIMLAQLLKNRGTPAEIHYLDMSQASRKIAEARAEARQLQDMITFHTGDLMQAADLGLFDYIDCCGVLHHLPDPEAGFQALAAAVKPEGGLGLMVYAPYGRQGVYELQDVLAALTAQMAPSEKIALARKLLAELPQTNHFAQNTLLGDHASGDAGLYDLLLHSRDQAFDVNRVMTALAAADLALAGWVEPARYQPATYLQEKTFLIKTETMTEMQQAALTERLVSNIKAHRFYARPKARGCSVATITPDRVPVLHNIPQAKLVQSMQKTGQLRFNVDGIPLTYAVGRSCIPLLKAMNGHLSFGKISEKTGRNWFNSAQDFSKLFKLLGGFNHLRVSRFYV